MARFYQVINADSHLEVPPDRWIKYVPEMYRDRAPRLVKLPEGGEGWVVEGMPIVYNGVNLTGGKPLKWRGESYWNPDGTPAAGTGPAEQRLREQDLDGVDADVLFPPRFTTQFIEGIADKKAYLSILQAYNTFLALDYCSVAPDRLIGSGVIPVTGIDDAVNELKRCKELGLKSVSPLQFPNGGGSPKPEDDRFWETALTLGIAVSPHGLIGSPGGPAQPQGPTRDISAGLGEAEFASAGIGAGRTGAPRCCHGISQLIAAGVLDRFPELRIYIAETNASWIPSALWFMDDTYEMTKSWFGIELKMLPSQYVAKHFLFSFIRDPVAMQMWDHMPEGFAARNLMWGSDFPHMVGSFPKSREWRETIFRAAPEELTQRVLLGTPAEFFGLDPNKPITESPS